VRTERGTLRADQVVLAVGGYHRPSVPRMAERLPRGLTQLHSSRYRNPESLPDGAVLVVGSGQSGARIAEDLLLAGRDVHLCVASAPRVSRRHRGRDCVAWLEDMGHYDLSIDDHPEGTAARHEANHYVTGRGGGRDIDLRLHALNGMRLHGRVRDIDGGLLWLGDDLAANLDAADATCARINATIDAWIERQGIDAPPAEAYVPPWRPPSVAPATLDLEREGITTVIWATGFRSDWSWVHLPAFDGTGYPQHYRGETSVPGLFVLGLPWLHTWGSGRFAGIARDAGHVAERIAARRDAAAGERDGRLARAVAD
jgi:putative flavoprotein involved in K+ transport